MRTTTTTTTSVRRCAVHLNNIRVARARNRVPASFSARFRPRKNITEPRPFLFKQNHLVRHGVFSTLHSGPCFVRLGSRRRTDGRTDVRRGQVEKVPLGAAKVRERAPDGTTRPPTWTTGHAPLRAHALAHAHLEFHEASVSSLHARHECF